jgi:hypothetical protein
LIPTNGKDDAVSIHEQHMVFLKMATQAGLPVISLAADGAASELAAQAAMDAEQSHSAPLIFEYPAYGVRLRAPVFRVTGPLISISDPPHGRKTCRNQPQHGTHTFSMGSAYVVNRSFVDLYETGHSGLVLRDVENVDKQDDGAARRMFHCVALKAMTSDESGELKIRDGFEGLFVYLFIFGKMSNFTSVNQLFTYDGFRHSL